MQTRGHAGNRGAVEAEGPSPHLEPRGPRARATGAMESFTESLNRLKEIHENEIMGLQNKLLELNSERCRDAQRVEELCAKNHQLREQQKALKENLRALENRLRAGLCDRCMVTQELARKKQQEFESSLLQNLQHVFLLTNELTRLQEENDALKEEVKRLQGPGPKTQLREGISDPPSPLLLPSLGTQKAVTEKPLGGHEETEDDHAERPGVYGTSPMAKISPSPNLPEARTPDMVRNPQRISNQLHGTIAVVRPGSQACSADQGSTNGMPPLPPTRSSPPSPPGEHSLPLDSFLQASRPSAKTRESLKHSLQADHLCLLNRHLTLHLGSPPAPATAPSGPQSQGLKAGKAEAWEETSGLLGLPGALGSVRNPRLEGALHMLLAQQLRAQGKVGSARLRGPRGPRGTRPSPPADSDSEGPEGEAAGAALPRGRHTEPAGPGSPQGKEGMATQDYVPDKPLDLSERSRCRASAPKPANQSGSLSPPRVSTPSPEPPQGEGPPVQHGAQRLSNGTQEAREPEAEEHPSSPEAPYSAPGPHLSLPSPSGPGEENRGRAKLPPYPAMPGGDGHPELSKVQGQQPESDELDEPDTLDSEMGLSTGAEATQSLPGEGPRCNCDKECGRGPQKRKRASDPWSKASKKPT
ncbi:RBBP8 N-terminal-like protein isoform X1 [Moschus berezovskii]|uniref:RBBP8 N-terminal-like protein isoform X1 n=1 Tax=Moschus berezovskii TaxID=68408 RepID=UPI0024445A18|nr:RBBP8 N-terminal-like protein isoform X1 [Moschus berezovskii]